MNRIIKEIYELEVKLFQNEVRRSLEKIEKLLSDDFFEFCSSGRVWNYDKKN